MLRKPASKESSLSFQTPITIATALKRIQAQDLVLPAIQREFVWEEEQITRLFDSILRGYPIGSFLSWHVEPDTAAQFKFYGFVRDYHQRDAPHCPVLDLPSAKPVVALLDGQQRLSALNIGLRGTYASKIKYRRFDHPQAFPARRLYVNVLQPAPENDLGLHYDFKLLPDPVSQPTDGSAYWFPVHRILAIADVGDLMAEIAEHGLGNNKFATSVVGGLYKSIHDRGSLYFYEEGDQKIDRVLDIFIRVNSGGTKLSHSDLLLSIATAQWDNLDARHEIQTLVDGINRTGNGFDFNKDVVLKCGLMLTGVPDVGFKVRNFNRKNMAALEGQWDAIDRSLRTAAKLLSGFGLSRENMVANSILIPISYYIHHRGLDESYCDKVSEKQDRELVRLWTIRALLKNGVWGSGLDTLLASLREGIEKHGSAGFPASELESRMAARGKSLIFTPEEIEDQMGSTYGWGDTFATLSLLFPHVNTKNHHHVDHVFPRSLLTDAKLKKAGLRGEDLNHAMYFRDSLTNLQLLPGPDNTSKNKTVPSTWGASISTAELAQHLALNALPDPLPSSVNEFVPWCNKRYEILRQRLERLLGAANQAA
jgi:hypothetical protein